MASELLGDGSRSTAAGGGLAAVALLSLVAAVRVSCAAEDTAVRAAQKTVPPHLKGYEDLYAESPREAARRWFKDAEFGLFVHYALASVLEGGKPEYLELTLKNGPLEKDSPTAPPAVSAQLAARFHARKFDADRICDLAVAAGMRYVTFTTKHLGGLYMYRTKASDFTSLDSPAQRDLVAEMAAACRKRGLGLFLYVPPETARTDKEHLKRNRTILRELLTQYGPVAGIWFDGIGQYYNEPENYAGLSETYALVRSLQPHCLISFKDGALGEEDFRSPEHFLFPTPIQWNNELRQARWETKFERWKKKHPAERQQRFDNMPAEINTTMQECANRDGVGAPGGWINDETARRLSADEVMFLLKVARSLDANLLLNIGPRGDGSVHPDDVGALKEVGRRIRRDGFPQ